MSYNKAMQKPKIQTLIRSGIIGTILSILVFFSTSFLTVLMHVNSPFHRQDGFEVKIGFPYTYYQEFMVDCPIPNSAWDLKSLTLDILITWLVVTGITFWISYKKQVCVLK